MDYDRAVRIMIDSDNIRLAFIASDLEDCRLVIAAVQIILNESISSCVSLPSATRDALLTDISNTHHDLSRLVIDRDPNVNRNGKKLSPYSIHIKREFARRRGLNLQSTDIMSAASKSWLHSPSNCMHKPR